MIVLIDTNVLLSAALRDRLPEKVVLFVAMHDEHKWLVTPEILREYTEVLRRPKFNLAPQTYQAWTEMLEMRTFRINSPPCTPDFPRDPKDAPFLAAALFAEAHVLISGDKDLLQSRDAIQTRVMTVREFATEFEIT